MKKGQIYEGVVKRVDFPNKGIIEYEGEKVVVKDCLPGQKIRFAVNKIRSEKSEGSLIEILEKSSLECREKACRSFGKCGGCTYQTMAYESQLEMKKNQVRRLMDQVCKDYSFEGILGSPKEWGYRNKMEFSFGDEYKNGPLSLGLHKKGSFHDILTVDDCRIVDTDYNKILGCILQYASEKSFSYFHKMTHKGYLRHLLIRKAARTGEILVNIVTTTQEAANGTIIGSSDESLKNNDVFVPLTELLLGLPLEGRIVGILHSYNDSQADIVQSDRTIVLFGREFINEMLLGLRFKISTFSFFQTNSLGAEVLYSKVREYVGETKDKTIFDLYSGTGTIAQLLAPVAKKVTGVEIVKEAVEAAKENAALNGLMNCEFIAGDVLKVVDSLEDKPDIIILDPPRDGIHPKALEKIINFGVDRIVYISCKPTSLQRDLEVLQAKGYKAEKICAVDMFPETVHVETVCLLSRTR